MEVKTIAVIGGTGDLGQGLVKRLADAGYHVIIGSRTEEKANLVARDLMAKKAGRSISGAANAAAAVRADVVVVAVPFASQQRSLEEIKPHVAGKIVIDSTVCLQPPKVGTVQLPPEGSAGLKAEQILGEVARVVSAFQNVPAAELAGEGEVHCDVLVTGNDKQARHDVVDLVGRMGLRGFNAGPMANSIAVEGLTSVLITINRQYKVHAGIRLTNIDEGAH